MNKDAQIAEKIAEWSQGELARARELAKTASPELQRVARQAAREAKRRHSKARRRAARAYCRDYEA